LPLLASSPILGKSVTTLVSILQRPMRRRKRPSQARLSAYPKFAVAAAIGFGIGSKRSAELRPSPDAHARTAAARVRPVEVQFPRSLIKARPASSYFFLACHHTRHSVSDTPGATQSAA
jgi:hypothetical protein